MDANWMHLFKCGMLSFILKECGSIGTIEKGNKCMMTLWDAREDSVVALMLDLTVK